MLRYALQPTAGGASWIPSVGRSGGGSSLAVYSLWRSTDSIASHEKTPTPKNGTPQSG
jgi:hypothetical protein